jgi:hypothetical protein
MLKCIDIHLTIKLSLNIAEKLFFQHNLFKYEITL